MLNVHAEYPSMRFHIVEALERTFVANSSPTRREEARAYGGAGAVLRVERPHRLAQTSARWQEHRWIKAAFATGECDSAAHPP
jgi:hypothetical protein